MRGESEKREVSLNNKTLDEMKTTASPINSKKLLAKPLLELRIKEQMLLFF